MATIRSPGCSCPATTESAVSESTRAGCSQDCQYRPARIGTRRSSKPAGSCERQRAHAHLVGRVQHFQLHVTPVHRRAVSAMLASPRVATGRSSTRSTRSPLAAGAGGDAADTPDGGRVVLLADHEHRPQQQDAQQQVGDRAGSDNGEDLVVEGLRRAGGPRPRVRRGTSHNRPAEWRRSRTRYRAGRGATAAGRSPPRSAGS